MSFSTFFNNPFTTFSTNYSSSYSSIDSTYSSSSTGSSLPGTPTQRNHDGTTGAEGMYSLLKPVTVSRPVTGTISTQLDTQPRPTIISYRHTLPATNRESPSYTTASLSLTRFLYGRLGVGRAPTTSVPSSGTSTPRASRSYSADNGFDHDARSEAARSREPSVVRHQREQLREQKRQERIRITARILREELEREGYPVPVEVLDGVNLGDAPYNKLHPRDARTAEIVLDPADDEEASGPYAAERAAGRRSSVESSVSSKGKLLPQLPNPLLPSDIGRWISYLPGLVSCAVRDNVPCARCVIKGCDTNTHDSSEYFGCFERQAVVAEVAAGVKAADAIIGLPANEGIGEEAPPPDAEMDEDEATQRPPSADTTLPPLPDVSVPNKTEDPVQNQEPEFVELPANELKTPPLTPTVVAITDDASSDKGKQRDTEHVHIITAHPDSEKEDERGWKAPEVTAEVGDWHVVEKTDDLLAASPSSSSEIDTKGKETAISHGEEVVAAIPEALTTKPAPPTRNLQDEEVHVQKAPKNELIIPPLPAPRNLDEEAASPEVPKDDVSVIIQDIAKALDTPITPEAEERIRTPELAEPVIEDVTVVSQSSKGADTPLVQEVSVVEELTEVITPPVEELVAEDVPAPALSPVTQSPAVTQPPVITEPAPSIESAVVIQLPAVIEPTVVTQPPIVTEPIPAAQPGIEVPKSQEVEVEPVVEAGPSIQKPEGAVSIKTPEFKTPTAEQKSPELVPPTTEALPTVPVIPVESDGEEESSPAAGIVIPIVPLVPVVPEKEADVEPAKPQEEPEEIAPGQGPYIPADDEDSDNDVIRGPEAQIMHIPTPITPVDEIEEPQAPKVTEPKPETEVIPPPTLTHSGTSETSPDVVTAFPVVDGVVQIGGTPVEEQVPIDQSPAILPPIPNLPRDVIEDLTPTPPAEVSPPPIPPQRNLQDEERPPSLTVELPPAAESPQNVSPVKTKPEFPEFGVSAPVEEQRPQLEPEDVPQAIVPPVAREEPLMISLPLTPEVINPVDTIKLIAPSAGSAAPSIRKISDEMADEKPEEPEKHTEIVEDKGKGVADDVESDDGNWVSKYKETGPEEVPSPAEEVAPRPVTPPTKVTSDEPETPSTPPTPLSPSDSAENAHKGADSASTKEKTGIRGRLTRTLSIGRKDKEVGDMRPGTSHSTTISVHSTDDRKSIAESTKRRGSTARALMGFGRKDKKEKDPEQMTNSEAMLAAGAGKAPSIKSVKGATSEPVSPPPVQRKTRDLMKLAIGKSKKKESESVPASPVEGSSTPPTPQTPRKGLSMSNAVNLMMLRKKAQDEKVKSAEAAAAAAAAAAAKASPPPTPAVEASSSVPTATVPAESASAPATPSTPTTAEIPAAAAEAAEAAEPAKPAPLKRRNTLTMNNAVNLMMLRKKAKEEAKEERPETAPSTPSAPAAIESAIDDSAPAQETPPPPPRRRNTITMGKAVDLMMLRKGKEKDDNSGPDADSSASPKKDKRMSMGAMFGRKKSAPNTPTLGGSNSRPTTPLTPGALFKSTMSLAGPDNEAVGPHDTANETPLASPLKPPSRAPSVHERPGTSASTRAFHNPFKKRTPSVYSHDIPDSSTPFNGPNSPFPSANGTDRPSLSHTESSPAIFPPSPTKNSDGEAEEVKPKTSRRLSMAFKPFSKLNNVEAAAGPSGQGDSQRPPTSASMPLGEKGATTGGSVSTSGTSGTVPGAPAAGSVPAEKEKRPRLGARAKTMMAFGGKKK